MSSKSSHYQHLKKKWSNKHQELLDQLWKNHKDALSWIHNTSRNAVVGSMAGIVMIAHPGTTPLMAQHLLPAPTPDVKEAKLKMREQFMYHLHQQLPMEVAEPTLEQKQQIAALLSDYFGMTVTHNLQGKELNRTYGYIGREQHLMRYPGDTIYSHFDTAEEANKFAVSGMAPGRGAWGYFTDSGTTMTEQDKQREKYYIAVQTFLAPGWNENVGEYYKFFKYRKMIVVNPDNGKAMVVVIGDAGPAHFTGKQLGGSPEVMDYLEREDGGAKGPVLYFFIDDPDDTVPLGPIDMT